MSRTIEIAVWWVALTVLELMLISAVDRYELAVAMAMALICAVVASMARTAQPASWQARIRWLGWLALLPVPIVSGTVRVLIAAARGESGQWREVPVVDAAGHTALARGARGLGSLALNAAPTSLVIDVDPQTGLARLHTLGGARSSALERAVCR